MTDSMGEDDDFAEGYSDGRNLSIPEPGPNRSDAYRHSFEIGRRERMKLDPTPAAVSRTRAAEIEAEAAKWRIN